MFQHVFQSTDHLKLSTVLPHQIVRRKEREKAVGIRVDGMGVVSGNLRHICNAKHLLLLSCGSHMYRIQLKISRKQSSGE